MTGFIEPMVGRYVQVEIENAANRIYFEENGSGIPLVCLHTAGSDARQWRHLLADVEFTRNFRIIAFDMPWHGKSNPPEGWSGEEYRLTTARYTETIRAFCNAIVAGPAGGDGLLDRRPHRSQSGNRPRR
jgi:pimeloyl-ACP methyl ester carboxylesterase